jgi:hypothetical protein
MLNDYKKLIPHFKNSPVMNAFLNAINDAFGTIDGDLRETFDMLNINKCSGDRLDDLGMLLGVNRPTVGRGTPYLQADNTAAPFDIGMYYVSNAPTVENEIAGDDYFRMLVKAQIARNTTVVYSVNALEFLAKSILFEEPLKVFFVDFNANDGTLNVSVNKEISYLGLSFLQSFSVDGYGRVKWGFPWPPQVKQIKINTV